MVNIYVLKLEKGKYYVGKTNNPRFRLENHFNSNGSQWTKKYKPLKIIEIKPDCDDYDEDKITRQYMDKYGIENVRGGSFVSINLEQSVIDTLKQMDNGTNNKCFNCGKEGHFARNCRNYGLEEDSEEEEEEEDDEIVFECGYCEQEFTSERQCIKHTQGCNPYGYKKEAKGCFRCGRNGHYTSQCYASTHVKGYIL